MALSPAEITLESIANDVAKLRKTTTVKNIIIAVLAISLTITIIGWLATSADNSATERNGRVGDCRSIELAMDLDEFKVIVSANATDEQKEKASKTLNELGRLVQRYEDCQEAN